jgi:CRP-like cAMP-binding protein
MKKTEKMLAEHPFLQGLAPSLLMAIASCATQVSYQAQQVIYHEGDTADQFLLVRDGKVAIEIFSAERGSLTIKTVGSGEVLGWSWLFAPYLRRFDARALERTRAIALDGMVLREKAEKDHRLGYELLKRFSNVVVDRLKAASLQLLDIYGKHA